MRCIAHLVRACRTPSTSSPSPKSCAAAACRSRAIARSRFATGSRSGDRTAARPGRGRHAPRRRPQRGAPHRLAPRAAAHPHALLGMCPRAALELQRRGDAPGDSGVQSCPGRNDGAQRREATSARAAARSSCARSAAYAGSPDSRRRVPLQRLQLALRARRVDVAGARRPSTRMRTRSSLTSAKAFAHGEAVLRWCRRRRPARLRRGRRRAACARAGCRSCPPPRAAAPRRTRW